ncbi:MAG: polysaccharide deacetylase family protein [Sediminicola sp.]|tara:strand:- start:18416 stop:19282 length:867 start_codon:yes stop_codon:yes gene_type:complete
MDILNNLGIPKNSKVLMVHADDAGLSHSENRATMETLQYGSVNSYSIMVPCPWFYEIAQFSKNNAQLDTGIHLTLTCEWKNYKFGPVLPISEVPSLVDQNGFFRPKRNDLQKNADPEQVFKELEAQVEKALLFGIRPTHLDSHMYSVGADAQFLEVYRSLGKQYDLPVLLAKDLFAMVGLTPTIDPSDLLFDHVHFGKFSDFEGNGLESYYDQVLDNLPTGLNMLLVHPAHDDDEMKGITVDHPNFGAAWRQIDRNYFMGSRCAEKIRDNNIRMITWAEIKNGSHGAK